MLLQLQCSSYKKIYLSKTNDKDFKLDSESDLHSLMYLKESPNPDILVKIKPKGIAPIKYPKKKNNTNIKK